MPRIVGLCGCRAESAGSKSWVSSTSVAADEQDHESKLLCVFFERTHRVAVPLFEIYVEDLARAPRFALARRHRLRVLSNCRQGPAAASTASQALGRHDTAPTGFSRATDVAERRIRYCPRAPRAASTWSRERAGPARAVEHTDAPARAGVLKKEWRVSEPLLIT